MRASREILGELKRITVNRGEWLPYRTPIPDIVVSVLTLPKLKAKAFEIKWGLIDRVDQNIKCIGFTALTSSLH